jgi:hypothetical protein
VIVTLIVVFFGGVSYYSLFVAGALDATAAIVDIAVILVAIYSLMLAMGFLALIMHRVEGSYQGVEEDGYSSADIPRILMHYRARFPRGRLDIAMYVSAAVCAASLAVGALSFGVLH